MHAPPCHNPQGCLPGLLLAWHSLNSQVNLAKDPPLCQKWKLRLRRPTSCRYVERITRCTEQPCPHQVPWHMLCSHGWLSQYACSQPSLRSLLSSRAYNSSPVWPATSPPSGPPASQARLPSPPLSARQSPASISPQAPVTPTPSPRAYHSLSPECPSWRYLPSKLFQSPEYNRFR